MKTFAELERDVVDAALIRHDVRKGDIFLKTPCADAQLYAACEALRKDERRDRLLGAYERGSQARENGGVPFFLGKQVK